jgi:hypothetical protein
VRGRIKIYKKLETSVALALSLVIDFGLLEQELG